MNACAHVADLFNQRLPTRPYCTNNPKIYGLSIRPTEQAKRRKYIQHNSPHAISWLVFDIDRDFSAYEWESANLPPPAWVSVNPENGRCHIVYGIKTPVMRTDAAHPAPLRLVAAIEYAYRLALKGDPGYTGLITKNPFHSGWHTFYPISLEHGMYDLAYLADHVNLPKRLPKRALEQGLGRNITLFDSVRQWAYLTIREYWSPRGYDQWANACLSECDRVNNLFQEKLPWSEIKATARSIAKWTWKNITPQGLSELIVRTHSPELQSKRGKASGVARKKSSEALRSKAHAMAEQGMSQRAIAIALSVSLGSVNAWLKTSPPSDVQ